MGTQNLNNFYFNKLDVKLNYSSYYDFFLASDANDFNHEVVYSDNVIGYNDGYVLPVWFDLDRTGTTRSCEQPTLTCSGGTGTPESIISLVYWPDAQSGCECPFTGNSRGNSAYTIFNIALTGPDNGLLTGMTSGDTIEIHKSLPSNIEFSATAFDRRFKMHQVTASTYTNHGTSYLDVVPPQSAYTSYAISSSTDTSGYYQELNGGFYQGFYKLYGYPYEILPTRPACGWSMETFLKLRTTGNTDPNSASTCFSTIKNLCNTYPVGSISGASAVGCGSWTTPIPFIPSYITCSSVNGLDTFTATGYTGVQDVILPGVLNIGTSYEVLFTISDYVAGSVIPALGTISSGLELFSGDGQHRSSGVISDGTDFSFRFGTGANLTISDIIVREKTTLNDIYPNNSGFFYYMGTRAENKFWKPFSAETGCTTFSGYCKETGNTGDTCTGQAKLHTSGYEIYEGAKPELTKTATFTISDLIVGANSFVLPKSENGGSGASISFTANSGGFADGLIVVVSGGSGYQIDDTITIKPSDLIGAPDIIDIAGNPASITDVSGDIILTVRKQSLNISGATSATTGYTAVNEVDCCYSAMGPTQLSGTYYTTTTTDGCGRKSTVLKPLTFSAETDTYSNAFGLRITPDFKIGYRAIRYTGSCVTTGQTSACTTGSSFECGYVIEEKYSPLICPPLINSGTCQDTWIHVAAVFERDMCYSGCAIYNMGGTYDLLKVPTEYRFERYAWDEVKRCKTGCNDIRCADSYPLIPEDGYYDFDCSGISGDSGNNCCMSAGTTYGKWLEEKYLRNGKLVIYVNGRRVLEVKNFEEIIPRALNVHPEKQVGVPFNMSWGGGSQGLYENITYSAATHCDSDPPYQQDPNDLGLLIEQNFAGTWMGGISQMRYYIKPLQADEIYHNFLVNKDRYQLIDCDFNKNCTTQGCNNSEVLYLREGNSYDAKLIFGHNANNIYITSSGKKVRFQTVTQENVGTITIKKNNTVVTTPFTVLENDSVEVIITKMDGALEAIVTLIGNTFK